MNKKGANFMLEAVAVMVLVLVVVVVLLYIFNDRAQKGSAGLSACETTGGTCVEVHTCGQGKEGGTTAPFECGENQECCLGMKKEALA